MLLHDRTLELDNLSLHHLAIDEAFWNDFQNSYMNLRY